MKLHALFTKCFSLRNYKHIVRKTLNFTIEFYLLDMLKDNEYNNV